MENLRLITFSPCDNVVGFANGMELSAMASKVVGSGPLDGSGVHRRLCRLLRAPVSYYGRPM